MNKRKKIWALIIVNENEHRTKKRITNSYYWEWIKEKKKKHQQLLVRMDKGQRRGIMQEGQEFRSNASLGNSWVGEQQESYA